MPTLKEMQQEVQTNIPSKTAPTRNMSPKTSLKEILRTSGVEPEEKRKKRKPGRTSLKELRSIADRKCISNWNMIGNILDHVLGTSADCIGRIKGTWLGSAFQIYQAENGVNVPSKDITVLDTWVMADWTALHVKPFAFSDKIRDDVLKLACISPWFRLLMNVSMNELVRFVIEKRHEIQCEFEESGYFHIYKDAMDGCEFKGGGWWDDEVTAGTILKGSKSAARAVWNPDEDIEQYKGKIIASHRLMQDLIHIICSAYVKVDRRAAQEDFPFKRLRDVMWDDMNAAQSTQLVSTLERNQGSRP